MIAATHHEVVGIVIASLAINAAFVHEVVGIVIAPFTTVVASPAMSTRPSSLTVIFSSPPRLEHWRAVLQK